jgi:hypothetical protein
MSKKCVRAEGERYRKLLLFWCNILSILGPECERAIAFDVREYREHAAALLGIVARPFR